LPGGRFSTPQPSTILVMLAAIFMKHYDHVFSAKGIENNFWMEAQSEPGILSLDSTTNELTLKISC